MTVINLEPKKLLGFKIIADSGSVAKLHSPKIGGKGCPGIETDAMRPADIRAPRI